MTAKIVELPQLNIIGAKVREARKQAGLSQAQLSARLELHPVYICRGSISRIENGSRIITDYEIDAISKELGVSLDYLFSRNKEDDK